MIVPETEIIVTADGAEVVRKTVKPGDYVIGREAECDVQVEVELVSRRHAQLTVNFDHALIEDLGSSNGTFINGKPVTEATRLWPNQKIQVGAATIELRRVKTAPSIDTSLAPSTAAVQRLLPEELLRDRKYDIGGVIAQGGMGAILDAREAAIQRGVAMKVMLDGSSPGDLVRFIAEARVTGQLEHPNIVPIHELGVDENGQVFYTMKMVHGITLKKILELLAEGVAGTVKKYPLGQLLTVFQKVCDAVSFAHSKGVLHRDLKPENVMIGDFGEVLLMDWGLAKILGGTRSGASQTSDGDAGERGRAGARPSEDGSASATMADSIMGTPHYMSPEQARGEIEELDARTDIYALGAILYHVLALRASVEGDDAMAIVEKVARGEIEPLRGREGSPSVPKFSGNGGRKNQSTLGEAGSPVHRPPRVPSAASALPHLPAGRIPDSLAAVVREAMALDKVQRYAAVADLQADLTAYQNGFATSAEKAGWFKRAGLAIKRNKAASIGIAAVLLVGATLGTKAVLEGRRAARALADLKASAPSLLKLAGSEAEMQQFPEALHDLDAALALDPALARARWQRAWVFIGLEKWSEAAEAVRLARQHDPSTTKLAAILPLLEELAATGEAKRWTPGRTSALTVYLQNVEASAELVALSEKFKLGAEPKRQLVEKRVRQWLGPKPQFSLSVTKEGLVDLNLGNLPIDTVESLRGLPIDRLTLGGTNVADLSPLTSMKLTSLVLENSKVSDLSPLAGMPLRQLNITNLSMQDYSPLRGMPLEEVVAWGTGYFDGAALRGAPLRNFHMGNSKLTGGDLSFLADAPIESLCALNTGITDLTPLRGKALRRLELHGNLVTDLSPLRGAPIVDLDMHHNPIKDITPLLDLPKLSRLAISGSGKFLLPLRHHPALQFINTDGQHFRPVAEFWAEYDAQQAAGKK